MSEIKGLIFDKDGTLFDFQRSWEAWAVAVIARMAEQGADRELLARAIGFDTRQLRFAADSVVIAGTPDEAANAIVRHLPGWATEDVVEVLNQEAAKADQVQAVDLKPLFSTFKAQGLLLGVVTNDAETPALAHLGSADLLDQIEFVAGCDSGFGAKPQAGQLLAFMEHTGLSAAECVMVGDSTHDLIAGRRAQTSCVGVLTGLATRETLAPYADAVLPDIGHLPGWLKAIPSGTGR